MHKMALFISIAIFVVLQKLAYGVPLETLASVDISPHIVGGIEAPEGHAPHMMALTFGVTISSLVCGASIISPMHVLTAAHCVDAVKTWNGALMESLRGVYGSNRWTSTEKRGTFSNYTNHPDWDPMDIKSDIAILYLKHKITLSQRFSVSVIALEIGHVEAGEKSSVAGWGQLEAWGAIPEFLQLLNVTTISEEACIEGVREAAGGWRAPPIDYKREICTLHKKGVGHGMCNGDSGSALVSLKTLRQIGIVSWGFACARGAPDMFVRVGAFTGWIFDNIRQN